MCMNLFNVQHTLDVKSWLGILELTGLPQLIPTDPSGLMTCATRHMHAWLHGSMRMPCNPTKQTIQEACNKFICIEFSFVIWSEALSKFGTHSLEVLWGCLRFGEVCLDHLPTLHRSSVLTFHKLNIKIEWAERAEGREEDDPVFPSVVPSAMPATTLFCNKAAIVDMRGTCSVRCAAHHALNAWQSLEVTIFFLKVQLPCLLLLLFSLSLHCKKGEYTYTCAYTSAFEYVQRIWRICTSRVYILLFLSWNLT